MDFDSEEEDNVVLNQTKTFSECILITPENLEQLKTSALEQKGGGKFNDTSHHSRSHKFNIEDFGADSNEKVEIILQKYAIAGGDPEVLYNFKKMRHLQDLLKTFYAGKTQLPENNTVQQIVQTIRNIRKKYGTQFTRLLGVDTSNTKNTAARPSVTTATQNSPAPSPKQSPAPSVISGSSDQEFEFDAKKSVSELLKDKEFDVDKWFKNLDTSNDEDSDDSWDFDPKKQSGKGTKRTAKRKKQTKRKFKSKRPWVLVY